MKILKVIHTSGHGGAENTFRWLALGLRREGAEVIATIPEVRGKREENWVASALEELKIPYLNFNKTGSPWELVKNIGSVIDQVRPDIVHSHLLDSNFYSGLACRSRGLPHVCTEHGDVSLAQSASTRIKYAVISFCSRFIVCVSEAVREKAARRVLKRSKLITIYNGIQFLEKAESSFRTEFGIPKDGVLIGNVGNLYPVKGQEFLIKAFAEVQASFPRAFLALVGRGGEEENLRQMVRDLDLPKGRVVFTGFRKDIENVMNAFDLYVQPSLSEGHPLAVLEAMSIGIPVIATAVGGTTEVTAGERYGTLVPPASSSELARKFREYFLHQERFLERAVSGKNFVRCEFSLDRMVRCYLDCYREALGPDRG
jgi:glycosyltransferase involved in cell wall biosynthesis